MASYIAGSWSYYTYFSHDWHGFYHMHVSFSAFLLVILYVYEVGLGAVYSKMQKGSG